ncbi:MAG: FG-GAP repeat domain-containing protein [Verrucomicrobiota bacterium]
MNSRIAVLNHFSFHLRLAAALILLSVPAISAQTCFTNVPIAGLPDIATGSVAWGDYDNDGRLDFLLTGSDTNNVYSQLWRNIGSGFTNVPIAGLPGCGWSSAAWGDYDNDGYLDFLLTGLDTNNIYYSQLWRNTGNGFTNVDLPGVPGVAPGSVAWGDYDNDGRLDFFITGSINENFDGKISQLWRNTGNGFTNVTDHAFPTGLPQASGGSPAWADYDNDGRLDYLHTGLGTTANVCGLWRNTGNCFTNVTATAAPGLPEVFGSSVAWGDYDNDGRLDFLISGGTSDGAVSQLWKNTGNGFTNVPIAGLPGVIGGSVAWGDYDNDGRLDFLITGASLTDYIFQLWRNNASGFTNVPTAEFLGVHHSSLAWGDYDNDGRLDFLLMGASSFYWVGLPGTGYTGVSQLWHNNASITNTPPGAPTGLALTATPNAVMLSWNSATDDQSPATSLSYNVRVGSTPGGIDLFAGHVNATNGFRRVPAIGNAMLRHSLPLTGLTNGQTVYWSVQAVDTAFAGGPFATETSVVTIPQLTITSSDSTHAIVSWTPPTWGWFLEETPALNPAAWSASPSVELNPVSVSITNTSKLYRLSRP